MELLLTCHECAGEYELTGMDFSHTPPSYDYVCRECDRSLTVAVGATDPAVVAPVGASDARPRALESTSCSSCAALRASITALEGEMRAKIMTIADEASAYLGKLDVGSTPSWLLKLYGLGVERQKPIPKAPWGLRDRQA